MTTTTRTYKKHNTIELSWLTFAIETAKNDELKQTKKQVRDTVSFSLVMDMIVKAEGKVESNIWNSTYPSGTEDRTWYRTYMFLKGHKKYSDILNGLDSAHAKRCAKKLLEYI